jgi:ureidoacrylate peracid hydrolase
MQNGFVSKGGSYDRLGTNIENYQKVVNTIKLLIDFCRNLQIPVFYTETVRESSGIDLLLNIHNILPKDKGGKTRKDSNMRKGNLGCPNC